MEKACPKCFQKIDSRATKCPFCQSDLRSFSSSHPLFTTIIILVPSLFLVVGIISKIFGTGDESYIPPPPLVQNVGDGAVGNNSTETNATSEAEVNRKTINYSSDFQPLSLADLRKDPILYIGKYIKLSPAEINNFLPAVGGDVQKNYLSVTDASPQSISAAVNPFALLIFKDNYEKAVKVLNENDVVVAYGIGFASTNFTTNSGAQISAPTIAVVRLDKCDPSAEDICASKTTIFAETYKPL